MGVDFKPLADRVLVEVLDNPEKSQGGIFIPESASRNNNIIQGTVVSRGEGALLSSGKRTEPEVEVGDTIMFSKVASVEINVDHKPYRLVCERDIYGRVRNAG